VQDALKKIAADAFDGSTQRRVLRERVGAHAVDLGRRGPDHPARHAERLPDAVRVEVLRGAGHMVQMEAAAARVSPPAAAAAR